MAVTEQQVGVYMSQRQSGKKQVAAAAQAGISERTARRLDRGQGGRSGELRKWRTRSDPFALVWSAELAPQLERDPELQALTLLEWLQGRHPGEYPDKLLSRLQRRVRDWRWPPSVPRCPETVGQVKYIYEAGGAVGEFTMPMPSDSTRR
jgi:hypothetical protein